MEKLTIKPWQVMQAHENGAEIEMDLELAWLTETDPTWNWNDYNFRISNLTADGMRLNELVEKCPETINLDTPLNCAKGRCSDGEQKTDFIINFLIACPECIAQVKVKQEKKLRPWTMAEFEKHRDEWFVTNATGSKRKVIDYDNHCVFVAEYTGPINYKEFAFRFKREDGSPCGVRE